MAWKKLSFCHKLKFSNSSIFATWLCNPFIFQTQTIKSNRIYGLKYQRSTISSCKDIGIRNTEFVAQTQFIFEQFWQLEITEFHKRHFMISKESKKGPERQKFSILFFFQLNMRMPSSSCEWCKSITMFIGTPCNNV